MNRAQYIIQKFFEKSEEIWYQGGRPQHGAHYGMFITLDREYAEKYARQHHNGVIRQFHLSPHAKIYPQPFWWEQYQNIWQKEQMFKGWTS